MAMATESKTGMETATAIAMATATARATMTKGGLPLDVQAMCSAVAEVTHCLHPHRHKGVCIHHRCVMGMMLQRVFAPFQGGGFLTAHHGLFVLFFTSTDQFTDQPSVFPPHYSGAQEPCQPINALPPALLFHIFAKVSLGGLGLCACDMQCCGMGDATARKSPKHPPPDTKKGHCPVLSHGR